MEQEKNAVEEENTQNPSTQDKTQEVTDENQETTITIEPITVEELYKTSLEVLQSSAQADENVEQYVRYLQLQYFGEDVNSEQAGATPLEDKRQQAVVTHFLHDKIAGIISASVSLDQDQVNHAFDNIFSLVGIGLDAENTEASRYDKIFFLRAKEIPDLMKAYQIMQLNRGISNIYASKNSTAELNSKIMQMENWYSEGDIDREQLAQFYYNIGMIYEANTTKQNTSQAVNREHFRAISYEIRALEKTNTNIDLVLNIRSEWQDNFDYDPQKILDACHRVIDNSGDERNIFRAHKLYADTLLDITGTDGFGNKRDKRINAVIKHYRRALDYVEQPEEKIDILNAIAEQQKVFDTKGCAETHMEIAGLSIGRARIREFEKIVNLTRNTDLKISVLKAGINEFAELGDIDNEDRHLYDDFDRKLRAILPDDEHKAQTLARLNKLKIKFGLPEKKAKEMVLPIMSSGGHDFFSER